MPGRTTLLTPVQSLLSALTTNITSPTQLQKHFTSQPPPEIHEHGLPIFAPFIGRTFTGLDGVARYFELLSTYLEFQNTSFENEELWIVDEFSMAVFLRGTARFLWKSTGESWEETFCYRVAVAEDLGDNKKLKVQEYRVWGDTGGLYLASLGRLGEVGTSSSPAAAAGEGDVEKGRGKGMATPATTGETRRGINRKKSGCGEVVGSGLNVYGSCGGPG